MNTNNNNYNYIPYPSLKNNRLSSYNASINSNSYFNNKPNKFPSLKLSEIKSILNDDVLYKRVKHCVKENERVYQFVKAVSEKNLDTIARLLSESHESLKLDYEVTGLHLDTIVEKALDAGAVAARMTGAGFGGSAIALVKEDEFVTFKEKVIREYEKVTNIKADIYLVNIVDGIEEDCINDL